MADAERLIQPTKFISNRTGATNSFVLLVCLPDQAFSNR
jgi:hypothetical protein